jgi:hypothetical protein
VNMLQAEWPRNCTSYLDRHEMCFLSQQHQYCLWSSPSLLYSGYHRFQRSTVFKFIKVKWKQDLYHFIKTMIHIYKLKWHKLINRIKGCFHHINYFT